jgi:hypothetical protein
MVFREFSKGGIRYKMDQNGEINSKDSSIIEKNDIKPLFVALALCHNVIVTRDSK